MYLHVDIAFECHSNFSYSCIMNMFQVFYCSRTHSQLAQFVHEVQRSPYAASVQVISMGSRQVCNSSPAPILNVLEFLNNRTCVSMMM